MGSTIGFLHTAAVHEVTFTDLVGELRPSARIVHVTDPSLLADAMLRGGVDDELRARILAALIRAAASVDVLVCTCSTIAGVAETMVSAVGMPIVRIDRPMMEEAVSTGPRVAVVAALEPAADAARALLEEVAANRGTALSILVAHCPEAWGDFLAGDLVGYRSQVERRVEALADSVDLDVVVLAQASMAGALGASTAHGIPVLSSPRPAVEAAIAHLPAD